MTDRALPPNPPPQIKVPCMAGCGVRACAVLGCAVERHKSEKLWSVVLIPREMDDGR